ncbi:cell division protein FtsX [Roseospira visakhapatnamensis]|uniref:Cell division transport system permease protein n=1 Tax=Roseospira visakhapatnamensis TaxID=390880 RepID=A0A7W6RD11_9PROT|nr:FtsX-like permease family protein [Roseospira visakhapatnamensis]MBB4266319.1 cell division transport system permease protein [Roseospira visakhapatnamensis]
MRSDIPLSRDRNARLVPVLVGVMVFLAVLAASGALALDNVLDRWRRDVTGTLTAQIQAAPGLGAEARAATDRRVALALEALRGHPAVASARALDDAELTALVEPWIGAGELLDDLPMPRLIDITLRPGAGGDTASDVARALAAAVPGASLDAHRLWLSRLMDLGEALGLLALAVVAVVGVATTLAIIHATRAGLTAHRPVIEVLHLIGAQQDYIARQFARHALTQGLKGGLGGFMLALPVLAGVGWLAAQVEGGLIPRVGLSPWDWLWLVLLPLGAAGLSMLTARVTVLHTLSRMP